MLVVIRVDSSVQIGIGHVMRCLTLANELRNRKAEVHFVCRNIVGNISETIKNAGFSVTLLPDLHEEVEPGQLLSEWKKDASETINAIGAGKPDWCVVDHYGIDNNWHNLLRKVVKNIFVIDDMANRNFDCDVLLDQTFGKNKKNYQFRTPEKCKLLIGAEYALLREEFRTLRSNAKKKRYNYKNIKRIIVSIGAMDTENVISTALEGLEKVSWVTKPVVDIVINANAPYLSEIEQQALKCSLEVNLLVDVENMARLMLKADLAIGAGGSTSWERCCLGLPSLVIATANNQSEITANLENAGAINSMGKSEKVSSDDIAKSVREFVYSRSDYLKMSSIAFGICDGQGAKKCVDKLLFN